MHLGSCPRRLWKQRKMAFMVGEMSGEQGNKDNIGEQGIKERKFSMFGY